MNRLQKNHKSSLKRKVKQAKYRKYDSPKTGRLKIQKKEREALMKKIEAEKAKAALEKNVTSTPIEVSPTSTDMVILK